MINQERISSSNVHIYVLCTIENFLITSRLPELLAIKTGFTPCNSKLRLHLALLTADDLLIYLSGERNLTPELLLGIISFEGWLIVDPTPSFFTCYVNSANNIWLQRLLRLTTGCIAIPTGGFGKKITVQPSDILYLIIRPHLLHQNV
jgi:hypothetical protein